MMDEKIGKLLSSRFMNSSYLPKDFIQLLKDQQGQWFEQIIEGYHSEGKTSVRLNTIKPVNEVLFKDSVSIPWATNGYWLSERPIFTLDPLLHAGAYYVQESSSMLLEAVIKQCIDTNTSNRILDLCAAPGGKSTHLLNIISSNSLLVSNEVIQSRVKILEENIIKWGAGNCIITNNDPKDFNKVAGYFDLVVIDAPCSGEGLFRRDPSAIKEWSLEHVNLCSARQWRICADVLPALKEDGILIYSTCTLNLKEDEEIISYFKNELNLEPISLEPFIYNGFRNISSTPYAYKLSPQPAGGEGFFIAAFRNKNHRPKGKIKIKKKLDTVKPNVINTLNKYLKFQTPFFFTFNETIYRVENGLEDDFLYFLQSGLRIKYSGIRMGIMKGEKLLPDHSLALFHGVNTEIRMELTLDESLKYLRKLDFKPSTQYPKGYCLVSYQQLPLGWVNVLDYRLNNYYPSEYKIRMAE